MPHPRNYISQGNFKIHYRIWDSENHHFISPILTSDTSDLNARERYACLGTTYLVQPTKQRPSKILPPGDCLMISYYTTHSCAAGNVAPHLSSCGKWVFLSEDHSTLLSHRNTETLSWREGKLSDHSATVSTLQNRGKQRLPEKSIRKDCSVKMTPWTTAGSNAKEVMLTLKEEADILM